jgi:plastocyanin
VKRARIAVPAIALLTVWSCFSDRQAVLDPGDDSPECRIPGSAIGTNRAVVLIRGFRFLPDTVRIRAGGTITWVNCEAENVPSHTSTSSTGVWDSGLIAPGESHAETFGSAGSFSYSCVPHPTMRGVVIVS